MVKEGTKGYHPTAVKDEEEGCDRSKVERCTKAITSVIAKKVMMDLKNIMRKCLI
jgi:hypothetical protein